MKRIVRVGIWCLIVLSVAQVFAQDTDCPAIVQAALAATDQACSNTGRNQACYGNLDLQAVPQPGVSGLNFSKPGDLVDVGSVQSLDLSPLDPAGKTWGVALMKLQANLPDTLPGQNVTFLLFGNVEIDNAVQPVTSQTSAAGGVTLSATVKGMTAVMESVSSPNPKIVNDGTKVTLDGYDKTMQMVHIQLEDGSTGWTLAQGLTIEGDVNTLPEMSLTAGIMSTVMPSIAPAAPQQSPMQAFYFKTGANDAPCAEAPDSGILIQTPEGAGKITLSMNGVDVQLGSTAYVQASEIENTTNLTVNVVEGEGVVKSQGVSAVVPAGTRVRVPLKLEDNHLVADGTPGDVEPYDNAALSVLPVGHLERNITVAPALTFDQIAALRSGAIEVVGGKWQITYGEMFATGSCPEGTNLGISYASGMMPSVTVQIPSGAFNPLTVTSDTGAGFPLNTEITQNTPNDFSLAFSVEGSGFQYEMHVITPTHIDLLTTTSVDSSCTITIPGSIDLIG